MLKSLEIKNFRCFESFRLEQLGQVNLLVGSNNSGKTSILEALQIFYSRTNLEPLKDIMLERGEDIWNDEASSIRDGEINIRHLNHLFYGHISQPNKIIFIGDQYKSIFEKITNKLYFKKSINIEKKFSWSSKKK
jgi:AAA15 family ATPase/GTPase